MCRRAFSQQRLLQVNSRPHTFSAYGSMFSEKFRAPLRLVRGDRKSGLTRGRSSDVPSLRGLPRRGPIAAKRSEEHTSELQSRLQLVFPLLLLKKKLEFPF